MYLSIPLLCDWCRSLFVLNREHHVFPVEILAVAYSVSEWSGGENWQGMAIHFYAKPKKELSYYASFPSNVNTYRSFKAPVILH